ncbi:rod shape-determining protein RodA [Dysgonomonas sp. Marseille-P4677]|uniref:rod shape-determining protein RodA n=1 Tax=Dysgonomonas sp. Marseille-P4677 TaxID=2364790 RepID=UPI001911568C|nr:rod shape-determining protein RodA [Dysgonomonas sp. Marseille-P4677]MBK5722779.1 rod shape-determining protein RodA [Dysgonomonas sp. Marseille-P4677]
MYQREDENIKKSIDWLTIALYIILIMCGWFSIYGASYQYEHATSMFDLSSRAGSQLIWMGTSLVIGFIILKLDSNLYDILAYYIYAAFILLLLLTVFIAPDTRGSRSWLIITDTIKLQPAEFAKFAVALALARFLNSYNFKLLEPKNLLTIGAIILIPMLLIFLQKETGSALVYTAFILMLYREGLPGIILFLGLSAVVFFVVGLKYSETDIGIISAGEFISVILVILISIGLVLSYRRDAIAARNIFIGATALFGTSYLIMYLGSSIDFGIVALVALAILVGYLLFLAKKYWSKAYLLTAVFAITSLLFVSSIDYIFNDVMQPHQQMRIKVTLGMEDDLMGAGYNVNQSKIAIGSGGILGKGYLNGTQTKLKYVPEQDTDFIFCTVGEEQGFVGSVLVLLLFLILILRLIFLAERQKNTFGRVYGYCVASIFIFHVAINIGMVIGLTPVIGIPLPFFSYGGSSLWGFTILLFIFLRIDMARKRR